MTLITIHAAAELSGVDVRTIRGWISEHRIKGYRSQSQPYSSGKIVKVDRNEFLSAARSHIVYGFYEKDNDFVSQQEAANIFDVSVGTIRNWISIGIINGYRVGPKLIRVRLSEVKEASEKQLRSSVKIQTDRLGRDMRSVPSDNDRIARLTKAGWPRVGTPEYNAAMDGWRDADGLIFAPKQNLKAGDRVRIHEVEGYENEEGVIDKIFHPSEGEDFFVISILDSEIEGDYVNILLSESESSIELLDPK